MSRQGKTENRVNKWNKRLLYLTAATLVVMLAGRIFWPAGEHFSVARDKNIRSEIKTRISEKEPVAERTESIPRTETVSRMESVSKKETAAGAELVSKAGAEIKSMSEIGPQAEVVRLSGHGTWESMEAYYRDVYADRNSRAFYADLTHDGQKDLIVLEICGDASDYTLEAQVTVFARDLSGEVYTLYERRLDQSHAGWGWLYLYEENGKDYLVEYDPVLYDGVSRYAFSVFYLTGEGEAVQLTGDTLEFDWVGEIGRGLEDQIRAFNQEAFAYMEHSCVIAAIGEEYFSGFQMCELGQ